MSKVWVGHWKEKVLEVFTAHGKLHQNMGNNTEGNTTVIITTKRYSFFFVWLNWIDGLLIITR